MLISGKNPLLTICIEGYASCLLSFLKHVPLIMGMKMICVNIYSNEYTFIIIIAERAWDLEGERLGLLLYVLDYLHS